MPEQDQKTSSRNNQMFENDTTPLLPANLQRNLPSQLLTEFQDELSYVQSDDPFMSEDPIGNLIINHLSNVESLDETAEESRDSQLKSAYSKAIIKYVRSGDSPPLSNRLNNQQQDALFKNIVRHKAKVGAWRRRTFFASCCPRLFTYRNREALIKGIRNNHQTQTALDAYAKELMTQLRVKDSEKNQFPESFLGSEKPEVYLERLEKLIYLKTLDEQLFNEGSKGLYDLLVEGKQEAKTDTTAMRYDFR